MHTVDLLNEAMRAAARLGYTIRKEWLDGVESGVCEFGGKKWIFIDPALNHHEQLAQLLEVLQRHPPDALPSCSRTLRRRIVAKAA